MNASEDHYAILGIRPGASTSEIRRAYLTQVKRWHPDQFLGNPMLFSVANERLQQVNAAFAWMSSPERVAYERAKADSDARKETANAHREPPRTTPPPKRDEQSTGAKSGEAPRPPRTTPPPKIVVIERDRSSSRTRFRSFVMAAGLSLLLGTLLIAQWSSHSIRTPADTEVSKTHTVDPVAARIPERVGTTTSGATTQPEADPTNETLDRAAPTHASALYAQFPDHQPRTMAQAQDDASSPRDQGRVRSRSVVVFTGKVRISPRSRQEVLTAWLTSLKHSAVGVGSFVLEVSVREGTHQIWLPVDSKLVSYFEEEVHPGDAVTIYTVYAGDVDEADETVALFVIDGFRPNG